MAFRTIIAFIRSEREAPRVMGAAKLIASSSGMGYLIVKGQAAIATDIVMAGMLAIGFIGVLIDVAIRKLESYLLRHRQ